MKTKSLRSRLIHGTKWSIVGSGILQAFGLLTVIIIANLLGKEGLGQYGIIQSTIGMFGVFAGLAMGYTVTKYVAEFRFSDSAKAGRFMGLTLLLSLVSSSIMALAALIFSRFVAVTIIKDANMIIVLRLGVPLLILNTIFDTQRAALAGLESFKTIAWISIVTAFIRLPFVTIGAWLCGVAGAIGGFVFSQLVVCIIQQIVLIKNSNANGVSICYKASRQDWLKVWNFSFPSMLSNIIGNPANWVCRVLLFTLPNGHAQMGIYYAADQWKNAISFIPMRMMNVGLPIMSSLFGQKDMRRYYKVVKSTQLAIVGISIMVALPIIIFSKHIMRFYGSSFSEGYIILILLLIAGTFVLLECSLSEVLLSRGRPWSKLVVYFTSSVLTVLLFWQVFLQQGMFGLAISMCLGHFIGVCMLVTRLLILSKEDRKTITTNAISPE